MALSPLSVKSLGVLASLAIASTATFAAIVPFSSKNSQNLEDLEQAQLLTTAKNSKLSQLQQGAVNFDKAVYDVDNFDKIVASDQDIESASRSIAESLTSGVKLQSFSFGTPEPVKEIEAPKAVLGATGATNSNKRPATETEEQKGVPTRSFMRLPIEISVSAENYDKLSKYLNTLSRQNRLISVVSIQSGSSSSAQSKGEVTVSIKAYAFIYKK